MKRLNKLSGSPYFTILIVVAMSIIFGTLLLSLPLMQHHHVSMLDCLFIATSALTLTGLSPVDISQAFNPLGIFVIMVLIQIGGVGIMTIAMMLFIALGRKFSYKKRKLIQYELNQNKTQGVIRLAIQVLYISLLIEMIGMLLFSILLIPKYGFTEGLYHSAFLAVSAFNNAGFTSWPNNMMNLQSNAMILIITSTLFIVGGLGFGSILEGLKNKFKISLNTKIVVLSTIVLNVTSTIIVYLLEMNNSKTLGGLPLDDQIMNAYFHATSPRTAGFNSLDLESFHTPTLLIIMLLMFIGGASASTAGGIKVTTMMVIFVSVIAFLQNKEHISLFKRTIRRDILIRSLSIVILSMLSIYLNILFITIVQPDLKFIHVIFEVVSAFGTVGLSMNLTAELNDFSKLSIILMMYIGKVGILTLAFAISKTKQQYYKYVDEDVLTG